MSEQNSATIDAWRRLLAARARSRERLERALRRAQQVCAAAEAAWAAAHQVLAQTQARVLEHDARLNRLLGPGRTIDAAQYLRYAALGAPLRQACEQALRRSHEASEALAEPRRALAAARAALVQADTRRDASEAQLRQLTQRAARLAQRRAEDDALDLAWARRARPLPPPR
ncbi:hypothetical protein [Paraburkholderia bonniea]|uniref:hypothetical protein n=1 Tax=Paraburkholderia bonniea TaxID=2152891 RepID=UPI001292A191|nr:hypothetical protein [Paraburkholderia bonniea]